MRMPLPSALPTCGSLPAPNISRTLPNANRPMVKPMPMPSAFTSADSGGFFVLGLWLLFFAWLAKRKEARHGA